MGITMTFHKKFMSLRRVALLLFFIFIFIWYSLNVSHTKIKDADELTDIDLGDFDHSQRIFQRKALDCPAKINIVYIKMIKCASETLASVFRRYGLLRKLSFVLPPKDKIYIGWPYQIEKEFYRPSKLSSREFNILDAHAVYNEHIMKALMPKSTLYVTSIRNPYSQFKSMFAYYNLQEIAGVQGDDPVGVYLRNIEKYETIYKRPNAEKRYCIPDAFSMSKNLMSFNLGFPTGFPAGTKDLSQDNSAIQSWLERLESNFKLVMLVEYFDESLILLRRYMCWTMQDIVYYTRNVGHYKFKGNSDHDNIEMYKKWSNVDYALYNHFEQVFWYKVAQEGPSFIEELRQFKDVIKEVSNYCSTVGNETSAENLLVYGSEWNEEFELNFRNCSILQNDLLPELQHIYEQTLPHIEETGPSKYFC